VKVREIGNIHEKGKGEKGKTRKIRKQENIRKQKMRTNERRRK